MGAFPFRISARDGDARTGVIETPRGPIHTPAFMPLGTAGTVKALTVDQVAATGSEIILGNTYHLMLRPTAERVARLGGLHKFMRWERPILTDSGGFQVMSLSKIAKVTEDAVTFQSHIDGSRHVLTPERSIEIQADLLEADIVMQLGRRCVSWPVEAARATEALALLSARWAAAAVQRPRSAPAIPRPCSASSRARPFRSSAPRERRAAGRDRIRWLWHRRPSGRRDPPRDTHTHTYIVVCPPPPRIIYLFIYLFYLFYLFIYIYVFYGGFLLKKKKKSGLKFEGKKKKKNNFKI